MRFHLYVAILSQPIALILPNRCKSKSRDFKRMRRSHEQSKTNRRHGDDFWPGSTGSKENNADQNPNGWGLSVAGQI
jgi:hypothetical protein